MTKKIALLLSVMYFIASFGFQSYSLSAQVQGTTALLLGNLHDKNGQPLSGVKYSLIADGKKIKGKTESDGAFQQVVKQGVKYIVEWQHPTFIIRRDSVEIPNAGKYIEQKVNFTASALGVNDLLAEGNIFARGSAEIISENELKSLAAMLKDYARLNVSVNVSDDMPEAKLAKSKAKSVKKSKKSKEKAPVATQAISLASQRTLALTEYFAKNFPNLTRRITIIASTIPELYSFIAKASTILPEL